MKKRLIILFLASILAVGASALGAFLLSESQPGPAQMFTGKALIGGPFTLTDQNGRRVTEQDFKGRFSLVFFGYTNCPAVCPASLQVISAVLDKLGEEGEKVTPVFITIDPERDTVERMKKYVSRFHKRLVGLTGSAEEIRVAARAYRIFYERPEDASATGYLMEHSSFVYLMSPDGEYLTHFSYGVSVDTMVKAIRKYL